MERRLAEYVLFWETLWTRKLNEFLHCSHFAIIAGPEETQQPWLCLKSFFKCWKKVKHLQVEGRVSVDVDRVRLNVKVSLQKKTDDLMVTVACAEVEGHVILVVLGIGW